MKSAAIALLVGLTAVVSPPEPLAIVVTDYATLPMTGSPDGDGNNAGALALGMPYGVMFCH